MMIKGEYEIHKPTTLHRDLPEQCVWPSPWDPVSPGPISRPSSSIGRNESIYIYRWEKSSDEVLVEGEKKKKEYPPLFLRSNTLLLRSVNKIK